MQAADRSRQELRADLILAELGRQGCNGLVPGERDLALGLGRLVRAAAEARLPLLSANLAPGPTTGAGPGAAVRPDSGAEAASGAGPVAGSAGAAVAPAGPLLANPFLGHAIVRAGELQICAVAVHGKADYGPEVVRSDPVVAAQRELAALAGEPCDVTLLLAHMDRSEADALLAVVPGFDGLLLGHQGSQGAPQKLRDLVVFGDGSRGRQVGKLALGVAGKAGASAGGQPVPPLVDQGEGDRLRVELQRWQSQIAEVEKRAKAGDPAARAQAERTLETLHKRAAETRAKLAAEPAQAPRVYRFDWINLGTEVADAPEVRAQVEGFERDHPEPPTAPSPVPAGGGPLADGGWPRLIR